MKMFNWESVFATKIGATRTRELEFVRRFSLAIAGLMTLIWVIGALLNVAAFVSYSWVRGLQIWRVAV